MVNMNENENKTAQNGDEKLTIPKSRVIIYLVILWLGLIMCIFRWVKDFSVCGWCASRLMGVAGGVIALATIFASRLFFKCPYCGGTRIAYTLGAKLKKELECPECKKKVKVK